MFSLKHAFDLCSGLCLLLLGLLLAGLTVPLNAGAQTSQAANYNPRQLDTQKIMGAFQQNYDDLTLVSAHRGIHALAQLNQAPYVPENSLEAIEWAAREGYEAIEVDVRLTSDGQAVLTHDKSWGREWCGSSNTSNSPQIFDPFSPNTGNNALANPVVTANPYSYVSRPRNGTVLRDSVSLVTDTEDHGCTIWHQITGEWPPTLDQVYADLRNKGIKSVLMIDVQSPDAALAAWNVVQNNTDSDGNPAYQSTIFKLPADMFFNYSSDFRAVFPTNFNNIRWIPVITTRYVAPTGDKANVNGENAGIDVAATVSPGFGSETSINNWIDIMEAAGAGGQSGQIMAVEVVMKESGGILSTVLAHVGAMRNQFGFPMMVGNFNPAGEYYPYGATQEPQYYRSSDGTCCDYLEAYLYNNPNSNNGVTDPGGPQDNSDVRRSLPFLFRTGVPRTSFVTTDDPYDAAKYLDDQRNQRNWRGHLVAKGVTIASNAVVLSLSGSSQTASSGDVVHLVAGLSDDLATGSVTFMDGGTTLATVPLTGQAAAYDVTETTAGSHTYTATYSGDATFSATTSNSFTVEVGTYGQNGLPTGRPIRILVDGDSMTAGAEGDYTWRYRLYQWFQQQGISVLFVGPSIGVAAPATVEPPEPVSFVAPPQTLTGQYGPNAPPAPGSTGPPMLAFNSNHAAVWGKPFATAKNNIASLVQQYQPDLVLVALGFNDMGWFYSDDVGTLASMTTYVQNAQAVNPNLQFIVADVPFRTFIGGRQDLVTKTTNYDQALPAAVQKLQTSTSTLGVAAFNSNYGCNPNGNTCDSTKDGLHPNYKGDFRIAQAFAQALNSTFGLGSSGSIPITGNTVRPLNVPTNLVFTGTNQGVTVTWNRSWGATGYNIQYRNCLNYNGTCAGFGYSQWSNWMTSSSNFERWDLSWDMRFDDQPYPAYIYQVEVAATYGGPNDGVTSAFSNSVQGVPAPQVATTPTGLSVLTNTLHGQLEAEWTPSTGQYSNSIYEYDVWLFDTDTPGVYPSRFAHLEPPGNDPGPDFHTVSCTPGNHYVLMIEPWNAAGAGIPAQSPSTLCPQ